MPEPEPAVRIEILLVDDDVALVRSMADVLRRRGYAVAHVHDGRAAMDFIKRQQVDLVISDVFMPEADGLELLGLLRRCIPCPPLVAMSGSSVYRVNGMLKAAAMLGAVRTLAKPFDSAQLVSLVHELIGAPLERPTPGAAG
ncbi:MAG TPA: response regulator [Lacunisphaera sp.]|nr:response regulator [Lacunisphaera sp.]